MKKLIIILTIGSLLSCKAQGVDVFALADNKNPSLSEIQEGVLYNLNNARIYGADYVRIPFPYRFNFFSENARVRLKELFKNKWTNIEIESNLYPKYKRLLDTLNNHNGLYIEAKKIAKKDALPVKKVWDSLLEVRKDNYRLRIINNKISSRYILKAAYLRDNRFLPYIKELIEDKDYIEKNELKLALARYGIKPYKAEEVNNNSFNKIIKAVAKDELYFAVSEAVINLLYVNNKPSIDQIIEFTTIDDRFYNPSTDSYETYIAAFPIEILSDLLKNKRFKDELSKLGNYDNNILELKKAQKLVKKYYFDYSIKDIDEEYSLLNTGW